MDSRPTHLPLRGQALGVLRHLHRLSRSSVHNGRRISYIHIYAKPVGSALQFITAKESGFEGIACVDDVARAAMLALQVYERTHSTTALQLAREWLGFVEYMQEPDGRFINFIIDEMGAKNVSGQTSYTGGKWWTARARWALAAAWRVTGDDRYLHCFERGSLAPTNDMKIKGVEALALMEMYRAQPDDDLRERICALCDSMVAAGSRYFRDLAGQERVALWGYHQFQAVARAGRFFSRLDYVAACEQTVRHLVKPVVDDGFYHMYPGEQDHQCAYDISPLILGLEELYRITLKRTYLNLARRCAEWLDGNNPAGVAVYDARTGCCSDGITNGVVSENCGAESAIEAGFIELARRRLQLSAGAKGAWSAGVATAAMLP